MSIVQGKMSRSTAGLVCNRVLVAERDESFRHWLVNELSEAGYVPVIIKNHRSLLMELEDDDQATVILDSEFDSAGPLAAFGQLSLDGFAPRVIVLTDRNCPVVAERAMKMGVLDFVERSSDLHVLKKALSAVRGSSRFRPNGGSTLLGISPAMKELRAFIRNVAATDAAVMIIGESGTGKELVAKAIHDCSHRAAEEFVPVNMAALPENLVESVLFGHEKGAFTGADARREGLCKHAHKGTLFLDEIGEMNRELQPKLLRFLQELTVQRVGSTRVDEVDVRIVSATNRNAQELVQQNVLREDLFFRLHVIPIHVPPLRERKEDIPLLANAFLKRKCQQMHRNLSFSADVMDRLCDYSWPGNIRQLQNMVERMIVMASGHVIGMGSVPPECFSVACRTPAAYHSHRNGHAEKEEESRIVLSDRQLTRMATAERRLIIDALNGHDGNVTAAARFLGVGPATIYRKIRSLEIPKSVVRSEKE